MWATLSVILLIVIAVLTYFLWKSDKECDEAETIAAKVREAAEADQKRHADEYQQALDEIVRLDANVAHLKAELDEANTSADHWQQRYQQVDEIRANLAKALGARTNGHQITLGNGDAKIVSDANFGWPSKFAQQIAAADLMDEESR